MDELLRDHASFVSPSGAQPGAGVPLQSRVVELEGEVARLREQLARAKGVNDAMWEAVVRKVVAEGREKEKGGEVEVDDEGKDGEGRKGRMKRARV